MQDLKRFGQAASVLDQALMCDPGNRYALGGLATALLHGCNWRRWDSIKDALEAAVADNSAILPPLTFLGYSDDPALQQACARQFSRDRLVGGTAAVRATPRKPGRIRLAYLSSDFHAHATSYLLADVLTHHDRTRFELFGISYGIDDASETRKRLAASFDHFFDVRQMPDEAVAQLLRALGIDIAIDLKGHTMGARPGILRNHPCPVQVNYLGYPGTMGTNSMDYVIADPVVLPPDLAPFFDEKVVYLEHSYQPSAMRMPGSVRFTRRNCGLPESGFVFCCFNNNWKITPAVFAIWMRILDAVPESVLWLLHDNGDACQNLRREASMHGIAADRLIFADRIRLEDHLARHALADLFLDTWPYNAHTTASDALWMGLPVLTCPGRTFAARVGASLLHAANLPELIATDPADYERRAQILAKNPDQLAAIRRKLRQQRDTAPLFDVNGFLMEFETCLLTLHDLGERHRSNP